MERILVIFGTRPEAIKLAPVVEALRQSRACEVGVCVTAQHREMLDQVLRLFAIAPDFDLDLMRPDQSLTDLTCSALRGVGEVIDRWEPSWVVVQGDTTTTFAGALAAFYRQVPVAHVEAGLRTGDIRSPWPEEMNRRLTSVVAELHFAATEGARDNLLREGVEPGRIHVTGNTVIDAVLATVDRLRLDPRAAAKAAGGLPQFDPARKLILVTAHRRESFGEGLVRICQALSTLASREDVELIYPVHLNPHVREVVSRMLSGRPRVHLIEPQDYVTFVLLMKRSHLIITDSGGIQEEAPALGKPVLVMRDTTERPEAVEAGVARLVGTDPERIVAEAERLLDDPAAYGAMARAQSPYGDGRAAERIAGVLLA